MKALLSAAMSVVITLSGANTGADIPDTLYGLFFEDINYAGDGGIYPELVNNRSFEYRSAASGIRNPTAGWYFNYGGTGEGTVTPGEGSVSVEVTKAPYAIINNGYTNSAPDMYFTEGTEYNFYMYAAADGVKLSAELRGADGGAVSERADFELTGARKYSAVLTSSSEGKGSLAIICDEAGSFELDFVSLMPTDTWGYGESTWPYGGLRRDLVEALRDLNPGFIRFPGGCIVEGAYRDDTRYDWKATIGPPEERRENSNLWGYMQSYGMGFHEYFQLCEDLGAAPVPILHAGLLCQARRENVTVDPDWVPGTPEFDGLLRDYLDLIEYANGDATTVWGAKRAANGHPEPFKLTMVGIGNEQWGNEYWRNFDAIRAAALAAYPEITVITTTGPLDSGWINDMAWGNIDAKYGDAVVDEHYYKPPDWFLKNTRRYDSYGLSHPGVKVFLGEYAAHENDEGGRRPNTWYAALCEAAYLTGVERNADTVVMSSYAPLFARATMQQWSPDMIWFNSKEITNLTPSYEVQKLFSNNAGTRAIAPAEVVKTTELFQASSADGDTVYSKLVNPYDKAKTVTLNYADFEGLDTRADILLLSGGKKDKAVVSSSSAVTVSGGAVIVEMPAYSLAAVTVKYGVEPPSASAPPTSAPSTEQPERGPGTGALLLLGGVVLAVAAFGAAIVLHFRRRSHAD
ncbi:hypothetical protein FACS18949_03950 [Clostridia bacterium]|nr:hypothetical protein FACS18949_03950 [Clostridia bacterium]